MNMGCSTSLILPPTVQPYEEIRFLQSSMRNIDRYFHHLNENVQLKQTTNEIIHVRDGVEKSVRSLLQLVALKDSRYYITDEDLLKCGSFYEGTKLGDADQFDYIVVLSQLGTGEIMIEDLNQPLNGVNVKVYIERWKYKEFAERWDDMIEHSYLIGRKTNNTKTLGLLDVFLKRLRKVAVFHNTVHTKFGTIELDRSADISTDGPSVRLSFTLTKTWHVVEEMKRIEKMSTEIIVVNITPAIRSKDIKEFIFPHDPLNSIIYNHVAETGSFLLIPASDGHFKKAFTETETRLMKGLPVRHLKAFRVLKYLINGNQRLQYAREFRGFGFRLYDSFAIKMLMLANSETCPCMTYTEYELFDCVIHVLQCMFKSLYDCRDGHYHIYPNIYIQPSSFTTNNSDIVNINKNCLSDLIKHELKVWIGERQRYDLSSTFKKYGVNPLNFKILHTLQALNSQ